MAVLLALLVAIPAATWAQSRPDSTRSISLGDALRLAESTSEALGIAQAGVERARGQHLQARSGYFPQLNASAAYTRAIESQFSSLRNAGDGTSGPPVECTRFRANPDLSIAERLDSLESGLACLQNRNPFGDLTNLPFGQPNQYNLGVSLSQTILNPRLGGRVRAASAGRESAEVELTARRAQLVLDVTRAYYDALLTDRLAAIAESTLSQTERTLSETQLARRVGTKPEFELLRAEVTRDTQRPIVIQRRTAREIAHLRLRQLLDVPAGVSLALTTELGDTTEVPLPRYVSQREVRDTAAALRAPVRQAAENVRAQEGLLASARNQRLPSLMLSSQYSRIAFPSSVSPFSTGFVPDWTVSLRLELPLFTGGRIKGDKVIAEANLAEARLRLSQTSELATLDSRSAMATLQAAAASWQASAGTGQQASRAYQIAEIRFQEGISTQTELADSRLLLQQAEANRAQAARDLQVARVRVALLPDLPFDAAGGTATGPDQFSPGSTPASPLPLPPAPSTVPGPSSIPVSAAAAAP